MRKLLGVLAASLLAFGVAGQASAVSLGYSGVLAIQVATLPPLGISGTGTANVNGSGPSGHLVGLGLNAADFATVGFVVPITDPAVVNTIGGLQITASNGAGAFAGSGGAGFGGTMPINGFAKVCLFGPCSASVQNLAVPLNVIGAGGIGSAMAAVNITVIGAPWTTGTAAVGTVTVMGGVSPLSNTGAPSGVVTLVTPAFVSTSLATSFPVVPVFGVLTLHFVPEPGTLVLLGSGIAGLLAFGRNRARK